MTWNYRICRHPGDFLALHEVYYDGSGNVEGWTEKPTDFGDGNDEGNGREEIIGSLERALKAARESEILDLEAEELRLSERKVAEYRADMGLKPDDAEGS